MAPDSVPARSEYTQVEGRVFVGLALGLLSLAGLIFPPMLGLGIAGIVISLMSRARIKQSGGRLRGLTVVWIALIMSVVGCLLSLVLPGFVVYVWIYALFHGGQLPEGTP